MMTAEQRAQTIKFIEDNDVRLYDEIVESADHFGWRVRYGDQLIDVDERGTINNSDLDDDIIEDFDNRLIAIEDEIIEQRSK